MKRGMVFISPAIFVTAILLAPVADADQCNGPLGSCGKPAPWNGQLMPTWNAPGFYGGWTTTPVICNQFTLRCGGYADQPNG